MAHPPHEIEPFELPEDTEVVERVPSVLVAEDDAELGSLIVHALHRGGLRAERVADGRELLRKLGGGVLAPEYRPYPDALVTDLRMPGVSGMEVLTALRGAGRPLPVVVITAFGDPEVHARALAAGARVVLDKPFGMRELLSHVKHVLNLQE